MPSFFLFLQEQEIFHEIWPDLHVFYRTLYSLIFCVVIAVFGSLCFVASAFYIEKDRKKFEPPSESGNTNDDPKADDTSTVSAVIAPPIILNIEPLLPNFKPPTVPQYRTTTPIYGTSTSSHHILSRSGHVLPPQPLNNGPPLHPI